MSEETRKNATEKNRSGIFSGLKRGLAKTRDSLAAGFDNVIHGKAQVGPELMTRIEESLLIADVGMAATQDIMAELNREVGAQRLRTPDAVQDHLKHLMVRQLSANQYEGDETESTPQVILVIGVNGSGKTTTIGKLAQKWHLAGQRVLLVAADTFRAAAVDQLQAWADRVGIPCIRQSSGADPSAVAFDGVQAGLARNMDRVIIDTAGRLQTNHNLMEELKKVKRVIGKVLPGAPHETILVLDATIGQNSLSQVKLFHEGLQVDSLIMTKLDGTAKGGVLLNLSREMKLPIRYIGVGEKLEDLQEFDAKMFVEALFEN